MCLRKSHNLRHSSLISQSSLGTGYSYRCSRGDNDKPDLKVDDSYPFSQFRAHYRRRLHSCGHLSKPEVQICSADSTDKI